MTKKHFIALAQLIKEYNLTRKDRPNLCFTLKQIMALADFCKNQNSRFDSDRWLGYIAGVNGPNGKKVMQ